MSARIKLKAYAFLSNPQNLRLVLLGLALTGLLASLGAPGLVMADGPAGDSGF
jgi:hypothetical protein